MDLVVADAFSVKLAEAVTNTIALFFMVWVLMIPVSFVVGISFVLYWCCRLTRKCANSWQQRRQNTAPLSQKIKENWLGPLYFGLFLAVCRKRWRRTAPVVHGNFRKRNRRRHGTLSTKQWLLFERFAAR